MASAMRAAYLSARTPPEALGDYLAGTNHVLPTAGTAGLRPFGRIRFYQAHECAIL